MKKTVLTLIAVAMMTTAMAQPQGGPRGPGMDRKEMVAKRTNDMKDKYSLTAEQVEKVTALNEKFFAQPAPKPQPPTDANTGATAQKKDKKDNTSDKKSDKKADKKDKKKDNAQQAPRQNDGQHRQGGPRGPRGFGFNFQQYNEELKTILTPEQYKKYESDMQQMRQRRPRQ